MTTLKSPTTLTALAFFKLLADETRLHILLLLVTETELCVCELCAALEVSQPKISRHLAMLRSAAVLVDRRQGQWVYYRLNPALAGWARTILTQASQGDTSVLPALQQNLHSMGSRPGRLAQCCN